MALRLSSLASLCAAAALFGATACSVSTNLGGAGGNGSTGAADVTSATATGSAAAGTGAGGNVACTEGYIDVTLQGEAPQHFTSSCPGLPGEHASTTALGSLIVDPDGVSSVLRIVGCPSSDPLAPSFYIDAIDADAAGTCTYGAAIYRESDSVTWVSWRPVFRVDITRYDDPGGVIEGTFQSIASVPQGSDARTLFGTFRVCRTPDEVVTYGP